MSIGALQSSDLLQAATEKVERPGVERLAVSAGLGPALWSPEHFAREQLRGLVRQIFFTSVAHPVKQLVISGAEPETDVWSICQRVGETLAGETRGSVAVVGRDCEVLHDHEGTVDTGEERASARMFPLRQSATRVSSNLWFLSEAQVIARDSADDLGLSSHLQEVRREFDYSIVQGPSAADCYTAAAFGQLADGLVVVLSAHTTRKATARKVIDGLRMAKTRLLGTVLSDRTFPIPQGIYRRL